MATAAAISKFNRRLDVLRIEAEAASARLADWFKGDRKDRVYGRVLMREWSQARVAHIKYGALLRTHTGEKK